MLDRRTLLATAMLAPILALPGCTADGGFSLVEVVRRLLALSSQRAFARLLQPDGFLDDQLARISVPAQLGGSTGGALALALLRPRLEKELNRAAESGARRAAPLVTQAITSISVPDAVAVVRGGPQAATTLLRGAMGGALIEAMLPEVGSVLRLADNAVVAQALRLATGVDVAALRDDVSAKASDGIFKAIGREEAAIRANPSGAGDPMIASVFGVLR